MLKRKYDYLDVDLKKWGGSETLFPGWNAADERVCVYSPHDDDAILGAGYAMRAAMDAGAEVHVFIVCDGACGYSTPEDRDVIVARRKQETLDCYREFGVPEKNILFLGYPDFSAVQYVGRILDPARNGHFRTTITELRQRRITRILAPNHYREHIDHVAAHLMAAFDSPQAGDAHSVDWAEPYPVRSTAQYSVWAELDPEDALVKGRKDKGLRADVVLAVSPEVEAAVMDGIRRYPSQKAIIASLVEQRQERLLEDGRFIEVYRRFDPRPKLDFTPYKRLIEGM
ncbi:MAG: PIG-L family deacetylase [Kiritimatiellae bacterium]|nr:PIG-L family deacetylase [Kiritimatiellia bacterium]